MVIRMQFNWFTKLNISWLFFLRLLFPCYAQELHTQEPNNQELDAQNFVPKRLVLPQPVSNNAVAIADVAGQVTLFSFNGLGKGKTYRDVHANAFSVGLTSRKSNTVASLPDGKGRLASIAVSLNNRIFVIGGYTVSADHSEVSMPQIYEYLALKNSYKLVTKMPVPVDDTVALTYQERFIYLVSGWHDTDNVNLVQVYDTQQDRWFNATPFPGAPVFGHAGGIVDNQMLIADGVKINAIKNGRREYAPSSENWIGTIDKDNPAQIEWKKIASHPFKPLYRMAAVGLTESNQIIFAGGSDNPYNYDGIGYDKHPSSPSSYLFSYDMTQSKWLIHSPLAHASMDHRGILLANETLYLVGGMGKDQQVLASVQEIPLSQLMILKGSK